MTFQSPILLSCAHSDESFEDKANIRRLASLPDGALATVVRRMFASGGCGISIISAAVNFEAMGCAMFYLCGEWLGD